MERDLDPEELEQEEDVFGKLLWSTANGEEWTDA